MCVFRGSHCGEKIRPLNSPSLPVIPNVRIGVKGPTFTPPEEKAFRGSKYRSSQGMTGGFWKTRVGLQLLTCWGEKLQFFFSKITHQNGKVNRENPLKKDVSIGSYNRSPFATK